MYVRHSDILCEEDRKPKTEIREDIISSKNGIVFHEKWASETKSHQLGPYLSQLGKKKKDNEQMVLFNYWESTIYIKMTERQQHMHDINTGSCA